MCFLFVKRVSLQNSSDEFKEVEALFCKTVRGFDVVKIERIQNKALWEIFQWCVCELGLESQINETLACLIHCDLKFYVAMVPVPHCKFSLI